VELFEWQYRPNVHEAAEVEEYIEGAVDLVVSLLCLIKILPAPVQSIASYEACEEVIGTDRTTNTNGEELE
jgi:hypothetical protein